MKIVILGLSIISSWGNGHATTYRGLVRELARRGHQVVFLERSVPWYTRNRDLKSLDGVEINLYESINDLRERFGATVQNFDVVVVGSYVPEGIAVGEWVVATASGVTAFYDIDTPVTLHALRDDSCFYLGADLVPAYDVYLSFTGGPVLQTLERTYGARRAAPLYCSVDIDLYFPEEAPRRWDLGYLGTYAEDRQFALDEVLSQLARDQSKRLVVAGPQYPDTIRWPANVERIEHLAPHQHRQFYAQQRFTLNLTRAAMSRSGHSPSVRLFEAAACGVPIISDAWSGIEDFFVSGREILLADRPEEVFAIMQGLSEEESNEIGRRARERILLGHTAVHRARQFEEIIQRNAML